MSDYVKDGVSMSDVSINCPFSQVAALLRQRPHALALLRGSDDHPALRGVVHFYQTRSGVLVAAEIRGLPSPAGACQSPVFAFHIHSGDACAGTAEDPFARALTHYNPQSCPHPHHAGDLPPLFGNGGHALSIVLTDRFALTDVIGRTVIVHAGPDDFTSQPAGNAGAKIACGLIRRSR